jgi:NAD(P)-dependent dehydrogenase (short-subunit alcohol dehydrogenase family)
MGTSGVAGKVVVITGASSGIGESTAKLLARDGARVVLGARRKDRIDALAKEITDAGGKAVPVVSDVSRRGDVSDLVKRALDTFERVDVLVNNAGMSPLYDSVDSISEELFDKVLAVNLKGPFRLAALIGTRMAAGAGGSIVNISSAAAVRPRADVLPYAAAKAGLNALTAGLARALGPAVRVNAIMAGTFLTDVSKAWDMDAFDARAQTFALQRGGRPEEIVGTALYLASDASSYTTGAVLTVDGGQ